MPDLSERAGGESPNPAVSRYDAARSDLSSGIIIHKSYLPLLSLLLRQYSALETPLPSSIRRRAPDQVIQDCIVGRWGSLCERERTGGKTVISSRIVLDHIGGMATTTKGKALNRDKWRCGWRHAFHGDEAVDVVVV
jgi:hypothetical protein